MSKVFISYRREDSAAIAGRVYDRLTARFGEDSVFKDVDKIPAGVHFGPYIQDALRQCAVMVVLIGPRWLDGRTLEGTRRLDEPSDWVRVELEQAFALGLTILPLLIEETQAPSAADLPPSLAELAGIQSLRVRNDPDFSRDMERVIAALARAFATQEQGGVADYALAHRPVSGTLGTPHASQVNRGVSSRPAARLATFGQVGAALASLLTIVLVVTSLAKGVSLFSGQNGVRQRPTATPLTGRITEYPIPTASSYPAYITAGPDGALWFTEYEAGQIGRITTSGKITEHAVPTSGSAPNGIAAGADGALWFTESQANKVGRVTTSGSFIEYAIPTPASYPACMAAGADGAVWFVEGAGNKIGRIAMDGKITEYPVPTARSGLGAIAAGPDGALWFTESFGDKIGRITLSGKFTEFPVPTSGELPGITAGPDGALWFTELNRDTVGRVTISGHYSEYSVPTAGAGPRYITSGPDGALWFTEFNGDQVSQITTGGTITEHLAPSAASNPAGIAKGPDGAVWFNEIGGNQIGRLT